MIVFTLCFSDIKTPSLCHFADDLCALLKLNLSDPYEIALTFIEDENSPCPEPEKLSRHLVHSVHLRFVQLHIFVLTGSEKECKVMFAAVNADHYWSTFFYEVTRKCDDMKWLGEDRPSRKELMDAATVKHGFSIKI